jgi:hypothetical protein
VLERQVVILKGRTEQLEANVEKAQRELVLAHRAFVAIHQEWPLPSLSDALGVVRFCANDGDSQSS